MLLAEYIQLLNYYPETWGRIYFIKLLVTCQKVIREELLIIKPSKQFNYMEGRNLL